MVEVVVFDYVCYWVGCSEVKLQGVEVWQGVECGIGQQGCVVMVGWSDGSSDGVIEYDLG